MLKIGSLILLDPIWHEITELKIYLGPFLSYIIANSFLDGKIAVICSFLGPITVFQQKNQYHGNCRPSWIISMQYLDVRSKNEPRYSWKWDLAFHKNWKLYFGSSMDPIMDFEAGIHKIDICDLCKAHKCKQDQTRKLPWLEKDNFYK